MSKTAVQLIREVGHRTKQIVLATATSDGTVTTIVDTGLRKFFPVDQSQDTWSPWVYAITTVGDSDVTYANERQAVSTSGTTAGTFQLSLDGLEWTSSLAYNCTGAAVNTALAGLSAIGSSNSASSASADISSTPVNITFQEDLGQRNMPLLQAKWTGFSAAGKVVITTGIAGVEPNISQYHNEQRARQWTASTSTITLYSPGFPNVTQIGDTFEIYAKSRRPRILEAINDGIRRLGLYWPRPVTDESLTTADSTWQYTMPAATNWARVNDIELEVDTADSDYPYESARKYDWDVRKTVGSTGTETWKIYFGVAPPSSRKIRVLGEAYYSDLSADTNVLPVSGEWQNRALGWVYDWAVYRLNEELSEGRPSAELEKYRQREMDRMIRAQKEIMELAPIRQGGRIIIPGVGTGQHIGSTTDSSWLGARRVNHA